MTTIGPRVGVGGLDVVTSAHREVGPSPEARCGVVVVGDMCPDMCSVGTGVPDLEGGNSVLRTLSGDIPSRSDSKTQHLMVPPLIAMSVVGHLVDMASEASTQRRHVQPASVMEATVVVEGHGTVNDELSAVLGGATWTPLSWEPPVGPANYCVLCGADLVADWPHERNQEHTAWKKVRGGNRLATKSWLEPSQK
eukprot:CAMPEP_0194516406 /NCGR_PEP_ID=MMETSP0253-20130528/49294_1 /TAXON_ID=2966 /ORGANISM="Noctiluca scintillans" /LENGTH=194 /DNA_ID=CAMNT_0039360259 /DNA_START=1914 /DNA_END=2499 /DNA_ORIENTATION=-